MILIILTYLAGALTILSPCILPVLPFVFSRSQHSFIRNGLPLLFGMCITFSVFSAIAIIGGEWVAQANHYGRILAIVLLTVFGISLVSPRFSEWIWNPFITLGSKLGSSGYGDSMISAFLVGMSTGLLWAPCAGPILGLVLTSAASQGNLAKSFGLLLSYSLGAATSLAFALMLGNRFLGRMKKFLGADRVVKRGLGIAVLLGVLAIVFNLDRSVLARFSKIETTAIEEKLISAFTTGKESGFVDPTTKLSSESSQKDLESMPAEFDGSYTWLQSKPLKKNDLIGKVVLIDFWTYSCINCIRTLPYLRKWSTKYKDSGLVVIGVHSPEFAFEKSEENVRAAIKDLQIQYPVILDNQYAIWNAFKNRYWPAHYFFDRKGQIRHRHFGEGQYEESERWIQKLLSENGSSKDLVDGNPVSVQLSSGIEAASKRENVESPETYVGYARANQLVLSSKIGKDQTLEYGPISSLQKNNWSLEGRWLIEEERAISKSRSAKIKFRFHARDLHLVLGSMERIPFKVTIDGKAPKENHGLDTDDDGRGVIQGHRLYQLIRQPLEKPIKDHLFEIEFLEQDVEAYAFTFG